MDTTAFLIVEDNLVWRELYADLLSDATHPLTFTTSYAEARGLLQHHSFALAIVDLNLAASETRQENRDGYRLLHAIQQKGVPAIVVSGMDEPESIDRAYDEYGVFAFVEKALFDRRAFLHTVQEALRSTAVSAINFSAVASLQTLTTREREVLALMTQGRTNRQIAEALLVTPNTIKKHVDHILQKLNVRNRAGAVAAALQAGPASRPE